MRAAGKDVTRVSSTRLSMWRVLLGVLDRLPQHALSRAAGRIADLGIPAPMRRPLLGAFARTVGIDLSEAELPLAEYRTLNELFVRRLRPGARTVPHDPTAPACPVDAIVGQVGRVRAGEALQAKGRSYSIAGLLDDEREARRYDGGSYVTLYLSPRHYHRIHSPCDGTIGHARHIPGALMPVNLQATVLVPDLFPRNERLVCSIDAPFGRVAVVAVGACNVGRIATAFDPSWCSGRGDIVAKRGAVRPESRRYDPPRVVRRGDEIMAFHLGSTVVLLLERGPILEPALAHGGEVRVGHQIARSS